jgi:glucosamine-6-phosphate deaminase
VPLNLHILPDETAVALAVAEHLQAVVRAKPDSVLALPSGNTPILTYRHLAKEPALFAQATVFALDEYWGLSPEDPRSFAAFFRQHVFAPLAIAPDKGHVLNGQAEQAEQEAQRYEKTLAASGGLDLTVLGLGTNGHIAFNEPADAWQARTHLALLASPANAVAPYGITMGIATLLSAPQVFLIATGEHKATAVSRMLGPEITPQCPASSLQIHPSVNVFLDTAAAGQIPGI